VRDRRTLNYWNWTRWLVPNDWDDRRIHRTYVATVGSFLVALTIYFAVERAWTSAAVTAAGTLYCAWQFKRPRQP
jgi:hypothetical protein